VGGHARDRRPVRAGGGARPAPAAGAGRGGGPVRRRGLAAAAVLVAGLLGADCGGGSTAPPPDWHQIAAHAIAQYQKLVPNGPPIAMDSIDVVVDDSQPATSRGGGTRPVNNRCRIQIETRTINESDPAVRQKVVAHEAWHCVEMQVMGYDRYAKW